MFQHDDAAGFLRGQFLLPGTPEVIISSELKNFQRHMSGLDLHFARKQRRVTEMPNKGKKAWHQVGLLSTRKLSLVCKRAGKVWQYDFLSTWSLAFSTGELSCPSWLPPCPSCSWGLNWTASANGHLICDRRSKMLKEQSSVCGYCIMVTDEGVWREETSLIYLRNCITATSLELLKSNWRKNRSLT